MIDGSTSNGDSLQDIILLVVLGVSVLIGVFASQLAGETWESVTNEIEIEQQKKDAMKKSGEEDNKVIESLFGFDLPLWIIGAQISLNEAEMRVEEMIETEYHARVWNCTEESPPPLAKDPARFTSSPENQGIGNGFDIAENISDGFVLSPLLLKAFLKYSDPFYDDSKAIKSNDTYKEVEFLEEFILVDEGKPEVLNQKDLSLSYVYNTTKYNTDDLQKSLYILRENVEKRLLQIEKEMKLF